MRILIADGDPTSLRTLQEMLVGLGQEVVSCSTGEESVRQLLTLAGPRLAILGPRLSAPDAFQVCHEVRKAAKPSRVYVILRTSLEGEEDFSRGTDAGVDDFWKPPFRIEELRVRLVLGQRILRSYETGGSGNEFLRLEVCHDFLTCLWNRTGILMHLEREVVRATREKTPLGVALIDVDHYKQINDTYGHQAGDEVLRQVARRMRSCVRPYDMIGRYGGDEFLCLAPGCDQETVRKLAERIRTCVAASPLQTAGTLVSVTLSLGVSALAKGGTGNADSLVHGADEALYRAKNGGRNRVELA